MVANITFPGFQTGKPAQAPQIRYDQLQHALGKRKGEELNDEDTNAEILKRLRSENGT